MFRGKIPERKFRDLRRLFALDITADRAADLTGLHHNTTLASYRLLRLRMAVMAREGCPFSSQVEIDETYFGRARVRGQRGRGAFRKTPVFGILERGGPVHCQIVKNGSKATLTAIRKGKVTPRAETTSDGIPAYHGLVEAGFSRNQRIDKYADPIHPVFVEKGVRIDGIESLWCYAKRRNQKFNGLRRNDFPIFLKETMFRFNNRSNDLYKIFLSSCRLKPLSSPQVTQTLSKLLPPEAATAEPLSAISEGGDGSCKAPRRQAGARTRRRPKDLRRQPLISTAAGIGHTGSVTPSGSFAPVMKATASDIE